MLPRLALIGASLAIATIVAGCTKRPPARFPERDRHCERGQLAYHAVGPGRAADERNYPDCTVLHWDDDQGGGLALCCPAR